MKPEILDLEEFIKKGEYYFLLRYHLKRWLIGSRKSMSLTVLLPVKWLHLLKQQESS